MNTCIGYVFVCVCVCVGVYVLEYITIVDSPHAHDAATGKINTPPPSLEIKFINQCPACYGTMTYDLLSNKPKQDAVQ